MGFYLSHRYLTFHFPSVLRSYGGRLPNANKSKRDLEGIYRCVVTVRPGKIALLLWGLKDSGLGRYLGDISDGLMAWNHNSTRRRGVAFPLSR